MEDRNTRVLGILQRAETDIASLATEAAASKSYEEAATLFALAQRVADMSRKSIPPAKETVTSPRRQIFTRERPALSQASDKLFRDAGNNRYPRFKREGTTLVKIGWSKAEKTTYEHRSPKGVVDFLVKVIKKKAVPGELFTTDELMPLRDDGGNELPSYQSYLCLGWLVSISAIARHGRQGYTLRSTDELEPCVRAAWQALATQ